LMAQAFQPVKEWRAAALARQPSMLDTSYQIFLNADC
jgi:hypothetical protein